MGENPRIVGAIVGALRFSDATPEKLRSLGDREWHELLEYADLSHLTLALGINCRAYLPQWVRERIDHNACDNRQRWKLIRSTYEEVRSAFISADVQHVVIKGFAQCPDYAPSPQTRFQSDIDLYCPDKSLNCAVETLRQIGYETVVTSEKADHLPVMIRRGDWKWRGNSYDPEMPPSIELHRVFWNYPRMRFGPSDLQQYWVRRTVRRVDGMTYPALQPVDNLGFSALQVLRDLLNNALSAHKVFELAYFLHHKANDDGFWHEWTLSQDDELRACEAISFYLAHECFGCDLAPQAVEQIAIVPRMVRAWIPIYGHQSMSTHRSSEKDAVWIHQALVNSVRDKLAVLRNGFLRTPDPYRVLVESAEVERGGRWMRYGFYALKRLPRHALSIPRMLYRGVRTLLATIHAGRNMKKRLDETSGLDLKSSA